MSTGAEMTRITKLLEKETNNKSWFRKMIENLLMLDALEEFFYYLK